MTHDEIAVAVADVIQEHVALSLAPVLSRLAVAEAHVAQFTLHLNSFGELRERVVVVETKAAMPGPVAPHIEPSEPVDLSPALERIAAAEARLETLGDLRDRVVTLETKSTQPAIAPTVDQPLPVDLTPVLERVASSEARLNVLGDLRDRVVAIETKVAAPTHPIDLGEVHAKISEVNFKLESKAVEVTALTTSLADHGKEIGAIRERVAVAEVRQLVPGPAGKDGTDGNGKDGADGLGFDDLAVSQVDERTFTVKCTRGLQVKDLGTLTFPVEIYRGVYTDGKSYDRGDGVTWGGSEWHCNETTMTKPGDGSNAWTLKVKRGRDGKDGRDAINPMPVMSVGKR